MAKQEPTFQARNAAIESLRRLFCINENRTHVTAAFLSSVLLAGLFLPAILSNRRLAFRDLSHFYEPLYRYFDYRSDETWFPLWSSLDHTGIPLAGDSSTALFYPLRLLFALPLSIESRIIFFSVVHLVIAGAGVYVLCRSQRYTATASWCASVAYCGSGAVFFLYCNPPFLVGASWLPWMFRSFVPEASCRKKTAWAVGVVSVACAVLGGDPQTAYHALLLAVGLGIGKGIHGIRHHSVNRAVSDLLRDLQWLGSIVTVAALLAAPQIAASLQWSRLSWRAATAAASVWNVERVPSIVLLNAAGQPTNEPTGHGIDGGQKGTWALHSETMFNYSIAPWHLPETIWPYVSGKIAPQNQRWFEAFSMEPRTWTPTLYMGLLTAVCVIVAAVRFRDADIFTKTLLFAVLCALGSYGPGFVVRLVSGESLESSNAAGDAIGGLYWLVAKSVPGYNLFRYPAKWLVIVALASAVTTAKLLSDWNGSGLRLGVNLLYAIIVLSLAGLLLSLIPGFDGFIAKYLVTPRTVDRFWGPVEPSGVLLTLRSSFIHATIVAVALIVALKMRNDRLLIFVVIFDVGLVSQWMLIEATRQPSANNTMSESVEDRRDLALRQQDRAWLVVSSSAWPPTWQSQVSDDRRIDQVELAQRRTWFVRWHLADQIHVVNNQVSISSAAYEAFLQSVVRRAIAMDGASRREFYDQVCEFLGCNYIATRRGDRNVQGVGTDLLLSKFDKESSVLTFHPQVRLKTISDLDAAGWDLEAVVDELHENGARRIPLVAVLESSETPDSSLVTRDKLVDDGPAFFRHRYVKATPESIHLEVETESAGFLRWVQMQDGNWRCRYRTSPTTPWVQAESLQVDGFAQGVFLPAGNTEVIWEYRPSWWYWSWGMTCAGIVLLGGPLMMSGIRKRVVL